MGDRVGAVEQIFAEALKLPPGQIADSMAFGETAGWDSLTHIHLMEELERRYGVIIGDEELLDLTTVAKVREYVRKAAGA